MRHWISGAGVFAVILLAACEPAVAPEPRLAPEPARTTFLRTDAEIDQALRMLNPNRPVTEADRVMIRQLVATMDRMQAAPIVESSSPPAVPPSIQRALRDLAEADGDKQAVTQILQRLVAERNAEMR